MIAHQTLTMISIVVPAYNEEKYIERCLKALVNQATTHIYEIIVVNNNSVDKTKEIAQNHGIKVVEEPRQGLAITKNTGANHAKGEIICFVDADCVVPADHIEKLTRLITKFPETDAFGGPTLYYDAGPFTNFVVNSLRYFYFYHKIIGVIGGFTSMSGGNMVIKKASFENIGGFNEKLNNINMPEDLDFSLRLSQAGFKAKFLFNFVTYSSNRKYAGKLKLDALTRFVETVRVLFQKGAK